jgi:hypothetical protein
MVQQSNMSDTEATAALSELILTVSCPAYVYPGSSMTDALPIMRADLVPQQTQEMAQ